MTGEADSRHKPNSLCPDLPVHHAQDLHEAKTGDPNDFAAEFQVFSLFCPNASLKS